MKPWRNDSSSFPPLLSGETAVGARTALASIAADLADADLRVWHPQVTEPKRRPDLASLGNGDPGVALFLHYYGTAVGDTACLDTASELMRSALQIVSESRLAPGLYVGFTGAAWGLAHLARVADGRYEAEGLESFDDVLWQLLVTRGGGCYYDLIGGLAGLAVYALERETPRADQCLERIVELLDQQALVRADEITWLTPALELSPAQRPRYPNGCFDFGLAHGVPGVVSTLAAIRRRGIAEAATERLCRGAVRWMLRRRLPEQEKSRYPARVGLDGECSPSRLAWCYGDIGIAMALAAAASALNEPEWEEESLSTARHAAAVTQDGAGVVDASLCHGAAGLAHFFNRLANRHADVTVRAASLSWFRATLELRGSTAGAGGYRYLSIALDGTSMWVPKPGLLEGAAGIGMALLVALYETSPSWDAVFLGPHCDVISSAPIVDGASAP
jgi:lantibiotic biosynthesis protein